MDKRQRIRTTVQLIWTALSNGYAAGFSGGHLYRGKLKTLCLPGLNCYSCPGSLGACPLGALQATLSSRDYRFAFYAVGFFLFFGALLGRFVCGFLCPFGLLQDLLHKIPVPRKLQRLPGERILKWLKYVLLVLFCILLPLVAVDAVGQGKPWFCAYICPGGTFLGGIPMVAVNEGLQAALGWLWRWKLGLLAGICILSIVLYRPFCRYLCPLGAIYGLFNPIAFRRYQKQEDACTQCGICSAACPMALNPAQNPNSVDCIRCGRCLTACPTNALKTAGLFAKK